VPDSPDLRDDLVEEFRKDGHQPGPEIPGTGGKASVHHGSHHLDRLDCHPVPAEGRNPESVRS